MSWIQTLDGKAFDLHRCHPDDIDPYTLSVVLSRTCRFGGHCTEFYSVAQHSLLVCDLVDAPNLKPYALLHDAHEAYWGFGDILRPAKYCLGESARRDLESLRDRVDDAIAERFGIYYPTLFQHSSIKHADNIALSTEARDLMLPHPQEWEELPEPMTDRIEPWSIEKSHEEFIQRLREIT